ncbi:YhdP family protein [Polaromonas sp. SM01]|uniref:YhdP family protein n=1 Tax=Polaromonas sp. SM01 TaxID=3085630 RepID=UPI002981DB23|nr:YhdP family protein [Polaromonas sp. SM01]MDW5441051.1 YhdP family protein [Polaromonas sp. SM01]
MLPARGLKVAAFATRLALWGVLAFWLLFGIAWAVLHGWIVPRIGEFRPRLEIEASRALGVPVRIGQITARSSGLLPSFELHDVALLDAQGRPALRLPRVLAAVSPASLWRLGFEQLYIDQPELDIRRTADGKIYVAGLDVSQNRSDGSSAMADWFFSQTEFVVRGGTVRWRDDLRQVPVLALTQVEWTSRNPGRRHLMRLDATPPPAWGERFSLRGVFREPLWSGGAGQWRDWAGQLYAEFSRVDASAINPYASLDSLGIKLKAGTGALRAWVDVDNGQVIGGTADVALLEVDAQLGRALEPLALEAVSGRVGGRQLANGFDVATEGLQFRTRDGLQWPGGNAAIVYTGAEGKTPARGEVKADKLDLAALAQIANRLPLGHAAHASIAALAPKGLVDVVEAKWQGPLDAPISYSAKGRVTQLEIAALAAEAPPPTPAAAGTLHHAVIGRPGVRGATVDFDLSQQGGQAKVRINDGEIALPGIFEDPRVLFEQFSAEAQWKLMGPKIEVQLRNMVFANVDAQGVAQASWHTAEAVTAHVPGSTHDTRFPGVLDLQGVLSRGDGSQVHRYLPLILPDAVRHYVRDAVTQGALSEVKFKVKGNLHDMPFADPKLGEFRVSAKVAKAAYAYVPKSILPRDAVAWPALSELNGELVFDRASLQVNGAIGRVSGFPGLQVLKADARIPDLMHAATVQVKAELKGPLAEALGFVNTSPLGSMTNKALAKTVASGAADYQFQLSLPLSALDKTKVQGSVNVPGNDVQFTPDTPQFTRLKGLVTFSESGFAIVGGQGRMLGGDIRLEGGTRAASTGAARSAAGPVEFPDASVVIRAQGTLTSEGLRQAKELGLAARLGTHASGTAAYTANLGFRAGMTELSISSNLQGMALSLPAPLSKSADTTLPLRFDNTALRESAGTGRPPTQDQLSLTVGQLASVLYVRDISGPEPQVIRGSLAIGLQPGENAPMPDSGVAANINLATVDIDAWDKVLSGSSAPAATPAGTRLTPASALLSYLPTSMAIRAKELALEGRKLHNVVLGGSRDGLTWRANIDATELNGYVEFRQPGGAGAGRLYGRLSRLSLGQGSASEVEAILDEQPVNIPALDIVVEDLELRGKKLGRVEIEAINRGAGMVAREGGAREWRLNKLNIIMPEATLAATGNWVAVNAQQAQAAGASPRAVERRRTVMNFKLDIADSGELLKRFGMGDVIRQGKGRLEGQIAWVGSPLSLDYPSLSGQFNVNVASGQFLKADPGIAKLLGVLSLQALPRRLTLDFRDVFSDGFSFDFVRGDVSIKQGLAFTNNLQMKGVNAAVLMEGSADIAKETQNLTVVVVPEINAGTASLIATVINPAIGLGSFLAQYFLRRPLMQATTQEFHIDGTWANPKITKVDHKPVVEGKSDEDTGGTR